MKSGGVAYKWLRQPFLVSLDFRMAKMALYLPAALPPPMPLLSGSKLSHAISPPDDVIV